MATVQEVSENWDDDFEFQVERRKMSTATVKSEATENWDDDFEDSRQSPKKIRHREESWDDDEEEDDAEFGLFAEEDRTVTARSRRAALARLSHPQSFSPTSSVFSVPTTIQTYSSTTHLRPTSAFALIPPSPPIHKERERRRLRKKSRPKPHGVFELADMAPHERRSFSDVDVEGDLPPESGLRKAELSSRSDLSSVDERSPPVAPTAADTSIGSSNGPVSIPPTPTKGAALLSRIGSVKKWGVRRKRGDSTAPADIVAMPNEPPTEDPGRRNSITGSQDAQSQSQLTSIISYLPTPGKARRRGGSTTPADVISGDRREFDPRLTPRASSSLSSYQQQHHQHPLPPALPPLPLPHHPHSSSSHSTPQLLAQQQQPRAASSNWFFRSASKSGNGTNVAATTNSEVGSTSSSPSKGAVQPRRSTSRSRVRSGRHGDGDGTTTNGNTAGNTTTNSISSDTPNSNIYSTRTPSASRTDLNEHEEISASRKVSWSGKRSKGGKDVGNPFPVPGSASRDGGDAADSKLPTLTPTTPPTKLIKRKSFGFVHLGRGFGGHGGGENEAVGSRVSRSREGEEDGDGEDEDYGEGKQENVGRAQNQKDKMKYAGLGLGRAGVKAADGDEYEENEVSKRSRRRSLSRFLMDRDKDKENGQDGLREKEKEKEKEGSRTFMGGVRRISLVSVGVVGRHKRTKSGSGFIGGGGGSPARIPPVPSALPPVPVLASASQVSLRIPSTTTTSSNERYASSDISNVGLQRAASLSSPGGGSGDPTSSAIATTFKPQSGSTSRPSSISSSIRRRRRTISKPRSKPRKSEELHEFRDGTPKGSLDFQQERGSDREPLNSSEEIDIVVPKTPTRSTSSSSTAMLSSQPLAAMPLLPPIELQPPSPPRTTPKKHVQRRSRAYTTNEFVEGLDLEGLVVMPSASSSSVFFTPTSSFSRTNVSGGAGIGTGIGGVLPFSLLSPITLSPGKSPSQSQQSVSLGRSTVNAAVAAASGDESAGLSLVGGSGGGGGTGPGGVQRRNSLGDLKIPARISQAQVGLRRDLGMVREFASNVEQLKELQTTYNTLVLEVQAIIDGHIQRAQSPVEKSPPVIPQATSPNFFTQLKSRPKTRARSNTNPTPGSITPTPDTADVASSQAAYKSFVETFWSINSKYRIPWECAELLIELGSGNGGGESGVIMSAPPSAATTSVSAPVIQQHLVEGKMFSLKGRERAITLMSDESKLSTTPPPPAIHDEEQAQVQSQPSSAVVSITGSISLPGGIQQAKANASGPPLASPPSMSWRASTGRHDLSQRQLVLLREMLNNANGTNLVAASGDDEEGGGGLRPPPPHFSIPLVEDTELRPSALSPYYPSSSRPQFVNRDWRWGDARSSTITLSEEQEGGFADEGGRRDRKLEKEKKRRSGRLGMNGIRDMLRSLKKSHVEEPKVENANLGEGQVTGERTHLYHHGRLPPAVPMMQSTTSLSTESSIASKNIHQQAQAQQQQQQNRLPIPRIPSQIRRRGRSSTGPESMRSNKGPSPTSFSPSSFTTPKPSPRRPSLASIFRIGSGNNNNKTRPVSSGGVVHTGVGVDGSAASSSAFAASEHDLSAAQCGSATGTGTGGEESNSTGEEEDWDRMDSASDLDAAAAKAFGIVDGAYDVSATVRGRNKLKAKTDERKRTGVSPYLQHQPSYESDQLHHPPPPPLPTSSSPTGLGGFLARHSIIPKRSFSASQSSIWGTGGADGQQQHSSNVPSRLSRHSNFEEQPHTNTANVEHSSLPSSKSTTTAQSQLPNTASVNFSASSSVHGTSSRPSSSRSTKFPNIKTGSVRSMPAHLVASSLLPSGIHGRSSSPLSSLPDPKLGMIMTPENIKPLLENAKEVHVKLHECIAEIRALIEDRAAAVGHTGALTKAVPMS